jgi:hypothetical protein
VAAVAAVVCAAARPAWLQEKIQITSNANELRFERMSQPFLKDIGTFAGISRKTTLTRANARKRSTLTLSSRLAQPQRQGLKSALIGTVNPPDGLTGKLDSWKAFQ